MFGLPAAGERQVVFGARRELREGMALLAEVLVVGEADAVGILRAALLGHGDHALHLGDGQRPQHQRVHHAEDGGVGGDAQREGGDDGGGEERGTAQLPKGEAQVVAEILQQIGRSHWHGGSGTNVCTRKASSLRETSTG